MVETLKLLKRMKDVANMANMENRKDEEYGEYETCGAMRIMKKLTNTKIVESRIK